MLDSGYIWGESQYCVVFNWLYSGSQPRSLTTSMTQPSHSRTMSWEYPVSHSLQGYWRVTDLCNGTGSSSSQYTLNEGRNDRALCIDSTGGPRPLRLESMKSDLRGAGRRYGICQSHPRGFHHTTRKTLPNDCKRTTSGWPNSFSVFFKEIKLLNKWCWYHINTVTQNKSLIFGVCFISKIRTPVFT